MTLTNKTLVKLQTTQHVFTSSVVVEGSSTSSMTSDFNPKLMSYNLKNCRTVPAIMMRSTSKLWRLRDVKFSDFST